MVALQERLYLFNTRDNDWNHVEESKDAQQANVNETDVVLDPKLGHPLTEAHQDNQNDEGCVLIECLYVVAILQIERLEPLIEDYERCRAQKLYSKLDPDNLLQINQCQTQHDSPHEKHHNCQQRCSTDFRIFHLEAFKVGLKARFELGLQPVYTILVSVDTKYEWPGYAQ